MGPYSRLFLSRKGLIADKWEQYLAVYDRELSHFLAAGRPIRLLEIGIARGGSLAIWEELLPPGSTIVGLDVEPACAMLPYGPSVRTIILDATDAALVEDALGDAEFDIIIDDGSHRSPDIIAQFNIWFPRLAAGGIYIIEDLHAAYWPSFGGGFHAPGSAIMFLKSLVDALHADYYEWDQSIPEAEHSTMKARCAEIGRVVFHDSIAVVERLPATKTTPYQRVESGDGSISPTLQHKPIHSARAPAVVPDDDHLRSALVEARSEISELRRQVSTLRATGGSSLGRAVRALFSGKG